MRKAKQKVNISNTNTNHLQSPPTTTMSANATAAFVVNVNPSSRSAPPPASSSLQREEVSTRRRGKKRGHEEAVGTSILSELQNAFHSYAPTDSPDPSHDKPFGAFSKKPRRESHVPVTEFKSYSSKDPYDRGNDKGRTSRRIRQSDLERINAEWERCRVDETTVKRVHFSSSHHRILFMPRFGESSLE